MEILEDASRLNPFQAERIADVLKYLRSNPRATTGRDLEALVSRVARSLKIGTWRGNGSPRFNEAGDKAFVDLQFHTGLDSLTYTATFHKINGLWALRGVREVRQAFAP
jgi:hypothetical protein